MNTVKTYHKVNSINENVSFGISKMEDIYTMRKGKIDEPHRHNFYTVLIINKATGVHKIDFNSYKLKNKQLYFVAPGQVHQLEEKEKSIGYSITFSTEFLVENSIQLSFIESLSLFNSYGQSPPLMPKDEKFLKVENFAKEIHSLNNGNDLMKEMSIGSFLKLLLIECNNLCSFNPIESYINQAGNQIIREFKKSVDKEYRKEHSTKFYASHLNITADHLNRIIKSKIGQTAKEYIQSRIVTEAKRLLYFTDLSNKEIGFELGFSEPANFSAFFKKCTKISPSNFKVKEVE